MRIRYLWWMDLLKQSTASVHTLLWGRGFGFPLIDFQIAGGITVREPHNDLIGILARMGLVSVVTFLWMQTLLILGGLRASVSRAQESKWCSLPSGLFFSGGVYAGHHAG